MKKTFTKIVSGVLTLAIMGMYSPFAFAAPVTGLSDDMTRQKISEASTHTVSFDTGTAMVASDTVTVTFPAAFTGTAATSSTDWAFAGNVATYTAPGVVSAGTTLTLVATGLINPSSAGNQILTIGGTYDTGEITVPIITDDQIVVTAKVDQTLTFDVIDASDTDNAVGFGSLTTGAIRYANDAGTGNTSIEAGGASLVQIGTNASGGYSIDVTGETLTSGTDTIDALYTAAAPTAGQEEFGITATIEAGTGTLAVESDYDTTYHLPDSLATDLLASRTDPASADELGIQYVANIDAATEAGNYSTAITFTATANF